MSELQIVRIDSRVIGFSEEPVRILALCFVETGEIVIEKVDKFSTLPVPPELRHNTVVVTDAPNHVQNWHLRFDVQEHLESVMNIFQMKSRAKKIDIDQSLARYNPTNILQVRKVDKNGPQQEFDSTSLNNGHIAVLLAVWASERISISHAVTDKTQLEQENIDTSMLPYSI